MKKQNRPIGIFDSGIGGLTVTREVIRELPDEDIIYFGDTARLPYGIKSPQTVIKFSIENVKFLLKFGVKFIIVACNTSSSLALATLRRRFKVPILGVIKPAVKEALRVSQTGRIGIIGTPATIASNCYQHQIKRYNHQFKSFTQDCPLFVPLAEEGWTEDKVTLLVAQRYLRPLLKKDIDTLILGCTHYPLLKDMLKRVTGERVTFVDSAKETACEARRILRKNNLCANRSVSLAKCRFYVSDDPDRFRKIGSKFLGRRVESVQKV